jgi:hypothetical protein
MLNVADAVVKRPAGWRADQHEQPTCWVKGDRRAFQYVTGHSGPPIVAALPLPGTPPELGAPAATVAAAPAPTGTVELSK